MLLTSCYDQKELNNIAIVTATEINKIADEYIIDVEIVNPKAPNKTTSELPPYVIYTGTGKTINEAYRQIKTISPKYLYPEHLELLIINEDVAKNNLEDILDFYLRNPLIRAEFNILIAKDKNILSSTTTIDELSSTSILNTLKTSNQYLGITNLITLNELVSNAINPNTEIVLPSIKKKDDSYELSGLAVFKDNKLVGYLNNEESIIYNLIKNNTRNSIIIYECPKNKYLSLEVIKSKSTIKITDNITININIDATINETSCNIDLDNPQNIDNLEDNIEAYLNKKIKNTIDKIKKEYNSDIFGFKDEIYKHNYKKYQEIKDKDLNIKINSNINITSKGSFTEESYEKN